LTSGIQEVNGGVARYRRASDGTNLAVSNEITGYAASSFIYFHKRTGDATYLVAGERAAQFLTDVAWDASANAFPFEPGSNLSYFFDTGIIARGLRAAERATGNAAFGKRAKDAALSLGFDFLGEGRFYPVITLPEKEPLPEEPRWSRQPGCYQLKSALIWRDLGDEHAARMFDVALAMALATHESFLDVEGTDVMDRLHAYCYFLEALLAATEHAEVRVALGEGIAKAGPLLRQVAPQFERSDVSAQLLRVRLIASHMDVVPLDGSAAEEEAARVNSFHASEGDPTVAGCFWFGRKQGQTLPFANPVSTAFCAQALALWDDHRQGRWDFQLSELI
jgi:hypothetical protein